MINLHPLLPKKLVKKVYVQFIYPFIKKHLLKDRSIEFKGFKLIVLSGIFHPSFFFSTKYLFSFIELQSLENKNCLEIGSGTGVLSLLMLRKKARVTAIDINPLAIRNSQLNYNLNKSQFDSQLNIIQSDLFDQVAIEEFDFIIINPPYFFAEAQNENEHAWYCGKNGEYFIKLFSQLKKYTNINTNIFMILSETSDTVRIQKIAQEYHWKFLKIQEKRIWWEDNYIFKISRS